MAQRQCITPFQCFATHIHTSVLDGNRAIQRLDQFRQCSRRIQFPSLRHQRRISTSSNQNPHRIPSSNSALSRSRLHPQSLPITTQSRSFTSTPHHRHGDLTPPKSGEERHITFIDKDGSSHTFEVADGDNLLDIAQANDLEMEGACGGSCACSTCHVIVESDEMYDKMEEPSDDENDMLDLAFGLTETSRLGCQVKMSKEMDGLVVS